MTNLRLIIPGSIRSKKNSKIACVIGGKNKPRRAIILPSKAHQKWEKEARKFIREFAIIPALTCPVHVEAHFYYKGPKPDLSGCMESLADLLQGVLYVDDGQIESWDGSRVFHSKENPRTEAVIRWEE